MMKQKNYLIFGVIVVLIIAGTILISNYVKQEGGEYIPPELRASATNLDENQARRQVETELVNDLGQGYFNSYYTYLKTEPVIQNQENVGYKIYYTYDYDIENFEPKEMYIYIGAVGQEHRIIYNKERIFNSPIEIIYSDMSKAEIDCLNAFPDETREITNWNHKFNIDTAKDEIILISTGQIENTNEVISCEFDVTNGNILTRNYGTKVTPLEAVEE